MNSKFKITDKVLITDEAVADEGLSANNGTITKLWLEPLANSEPTPLVEILLSDGSTGVVGQHEVIKRVG